MNDTPQSLSIDIWYDDSKDELGDSEIDTLLAILSDDERQRYRRFTFPKSAQQFLKARALLRRVLAQYIGCRPQQLVFTYNENGKPFIANVSNAPEFNLSHTDGLIVCAISNASLGIDAEKINTNRVADNLAQRVMSENDYQHYMNLNSAHKPHYFYRHWTLIEAAAKAYGVTLASVLQKLSINQKQQPGCYTLQHQDEARFTLQAYYQQWSQDYALAVACSSDMDMQCKYYPFYGFDG